MRSFTVFLLYLVLPAIVFGQETTGTIKGSITDSSGAVVPGAQIEISSPSLIRAQALVSDSSGTYQFPSLPPGIYAVSVSSHGFSTAKRTGVDLQVGKILKIDVQLEVGGAQQIVEVVSDAAIVDVSQSTVAANVSASTMDMLPKSRSFDSLIALAPGARYESTSAGYQVDGASGSENLFVIDGMDLTNIYSGTLDRSGQIPIEFVQEMQVKSSGFEAQYGGAMGGVVNVVTKSGSNAFHGDITSYFGSDAFRPRPRPVQMLDPENDDLLMYFHGKKDEYRSINPGGSLGGPIMKDKMWFFAGYYPEFLQIRPRCHLQHRRQHPALRSKRPLRLLDGQDRRCPVCQAAPVYELHLLPVAAERRSARA